MIVLFFEVFNKSMIVNRKLHKIDCQTEKIHRE